MDAMLRKALRKHNGLRQQLDNMLLGDNGDEVETELKKFLTKRPCWIPVVEKPKLVSNLKLTTIDFDSPARLPFNGAVLEVHQGSGIVTLERKADGGYLNGKKLGLFLSEGQKNGSKRGHDLRTELEARGHNVSAKVLDACVEHPEFWPDEWKKDEKGNTLYVFFWDDIFRRPANGDLYVRYGYWGGGKVVSSYDWLDYKWNSSNPSASSAS